MARLNDEGQWIVLMAFVVAISLFFLAIIISESTLVGQTTSEAVLDLSKADIQNIHAKTKDLAAYNSISNLDAETVKDIEKLYLVRKSAIVNITVQNPSATFPFEPPYNVTLHYNNGITNFNGYIVERLDR
jgi:hypothetical protein